jgi:hypothetical protein
MGTRATVIKAGFALGVAVDLRMGTLPRHALGFGSTGHSPALHTLDQHQPAAEVQPGITVGHENLRTVQDETSPTAPRGPSYVNPPGVLSRETFPLMITLTCRTGAA